MVTKRLKTLGRVAGFLAYLLITFEMLFMITPFALYYYSAYSPLLDKLSSFPGTAWMLAFFLPHLSTEIVPSIGELILLLGLAGFLFNAFQLYYTKFKRRGVAQRGFYQSIRHPQYLFLALAGLGLLILWPRFILLIVYITMLLLYYLLARDEERRMQARYGEAYRELQQRTAMFLPGELGGRMAQRFFHWINHRGLRLLVIYGTALGVAISGAFALRVLSLDWTEHLNLPGRQLAAVSFLPHNGPPLLELIELAYAAEPIPTQIKRHPDWLLIHAVEGKRRVVHFMIDAGLTRQKAQSLPLAETGVKLIFSRRKGTTPHPEPFSAGVRWQPMFIAEISEGKIARVIELEPDLFRGNPVMPIF